jgi:hypothetical protein
VTDAGTKPVRLIEIVVVADDAGAASTRPSVVAAIQMTLRIFGTPLFKRLMGPFLPATIPTRRDG